MHNQGHAVHSRSSKSESHWLRNAALTVITLSPFSIAHAGDSQLCDALAQNAKTARELGKKEANAIKNLVGAPLPLGVECSSMGDVISRTVGGSGGGKLLEPPKPLDTAKAEAELQRATADEDIKRKLAALQEGIPDAVSRLLYEASIFDSAEFYDARDLRILQFKQAQKD
jgi:hypothetical protein